MTTADFLPRLVLTGGSLVLTAYGAYRNYRFKEDEDEDLCNLSVTRGWDYEPLGGAGVLGLQPPSSMGESLDPVYERTCLKHVFQAVVRERLRGESAGMPFESFEVRGREITEGKKGRVYFGVAGLKCRLKLGLFSIVHKDVATFFRSVVGQHSVETFNKKFDHHFYVDCDNEMGARHFLSPEVTSFLVTHLTGRLYWLGDRLCLVWEGPASADMVVEAEGFLSDLWALVPAELKVLSP